MSVSTTFLDELYNKITSLNNPTINIYIVGSSALSEYTNASWKPNDVDIIVSNIKPNEIKGYVLYDGRRRRRTTEKPGSRISKNSVTRVEIRKVIYDIFTCTTNDISAYMDRRFDLNICCIGYKLVPYNHNNSIFELLKVIHRLYPYISKDVRKIIVSFVVSTEYAKEWIYGDRFDHEAAMGNGYAVLEWKKSFTKPNPGVVSKAKRGFSRFVKYQKRGYKVAEYPSRMDDYDVKQVFNAGHEQLARRDMKRQKQFELSEYMEKL